MKRFLFTLSLLLSVFSAAIAQQASDALRYSSNQYLGTARSIGAGNAMSVLGGDFGAIGINPAGLATYRSSDFSVSMGYLNTSTNAQLLGNGNTNWNELAGKVTFNNIGLVLSSKPLGNSRWKTGNFAIGFNKLNDFNRTIYYQGTSPGSIVTLFKNQASAGIWDDFGNGLAYDAEALYDSTIAGKKRYYSDFDGKEGASIKRSQAVNTKGRTTEMVISYAGNFDEKLYVGATIGIPFVKYTYDNNYGEDDASKEVPYFNNLNYRDKYTTDGTGVNLKIGAIYRPAQFVRIGASIHTPSSITFSESHTTDFTYNYTTNSGKNYNNEVQSLEGISKYNINTPWKAIGSVGFIIGKSGFVTAEAEYINYSSARVRFNSPDSIGTQRIQELKDYENVVNNKIKDQYKSALNIRVGGEVVLDIFRLRAGVNLLGNANKADSGVRMVYTAGAGVRGARSYFDIAYRNEKQNFSYQPYLAAEPARQPNIEIAPTQHSLVATLGFRF
jgi:hypothetical protein